MKTPGQIAYEADVQHQPVYHDGTARRPWSALCEVAKWSWERNPTPRALLAAAAARPKMQAA